MDVKSVIFGFFVVAAATLNFSFFVGDITRPELHSAYLLAAAVIANGWQPCSRFVTCKLHGVRLHKSLRTPNLRVSPS